MNTSRAKQLVAEIQDLTRQYEAEVGSKRKPWPKSIKDRAIELFSLPVAHKETSAMLDIPYSTIMSWKYPKKKNTKKNFHALAVRDSKPPTLTVRCSDSQTPDSSVIITVRTSDGWTLEIPSAVFAVVFPQLRQGNR